MFITIDGYITFSPISIFLGIPEIKAKASKFEMAGEDTLRIYMSNRENCNRLCRIFAFLTLKYKLKENKYDSKHRSEALKRKNIKTCIVLKLNQKYKHET